MTDLPFIPIAAPIVGERGIALVDEAVRSGWVSSLGAFIDKFEAGFAAFCGTKHAIALSNGTVALHLALHALGLKAGDEVIIPDLTFAATAHAVLLTGATPVLADVEADTFCLDPRAALRAITPKTRAIIPVHLFGHPVDMDAITSDARARDLLVIEDAAEAHGAKIGDRTVGGIGKVGAFSFYGNKIITTGEGGALTTDDDALAARLRFLKDHGMSKERRYFHTELAFNYRITNLAAALGCAQLEQADTFIEKKRRIIAWYREELGSDDRVTLSIERKGFKSVYWMACAVLGDEVKVERDEVMTRLKAKGVDSRPFFAAMSELPHLQSLRKVGASGEATPVSTRLARRGLNLPSGCSLTREDVARVAAALKSALD